MKTGIGTYRYTFTLQTPTRTSNGAGGTTTSWATVDTVKGRFASGDTADERATGDRVRGTRKGVIELRYRKAVTTAMRLVLGTREFQIIAVLDGTNEVGQHGRVRVRAEERVG